MRHEDWVQYQKQEEMASLGKFGKPTQAKPDKAEELRTEVQALAGRIKAELLAELKIEVERLIATETKNGHGHTDTTQGQNTVNLIDGKKPHPAGCSADEP